jgi:hypothetical protein
MDKSRRQRIISALTEKGADTACPRCGGTNLDIVAETSLPIVIDSPIGASQIPIVIVACHTCGYLAQHALARLELAAGGSND